MIKLLVALVLAAAPLLSNDISAYTATQDFHHRPGWHCATEQMGATVVTTETTTQETMTLADGRVVVDNGFHLESHDVGGFPIVSCGPSKVSE